MLNAKEWLEANGYDPASAGCYRTPDKQGPCVAPCPTLSQRAEDVWGVFGESMVTFVGMAVGMGPDHENAERIASLCRIETPAEFWMLFGDLERIWVEMMNRKEDE